jgi:glycosyltransferase involved in cell wall biosynthesis
VFRPTESDFRERHGLQGKKIVLGVATAWGKKKGIGDFALLSQRLGEEYKVVLVGVNKDTVGALPQNILCLPRTNSTEELAGIYSSADVFFNPSVEETMGLTTVEALACGTPAIVYNRTAVPEIVDEKSGVVLPCTIDGFEEAYEKAVALRKEDILARASAYEKTERYLEFIRLYEECVK